MNLDDLVGKLDGVRKLPSGYAARCPAHDDRVASLMVNQGRRQPIIVHCHAGCTADAVMAALGLSTQDLMGKSEPEIVYQYLNADGTVAYEVERWRNPKTFRVRGRLPSPAERVLYQLPALHWARSAGVTVHYVEGEKDADRLIAEGLLGTTSVGGAGSWLGHYAEQLVDCHVTVYADNDPPGRAHARTVAASLRPYAASVTLVVPRHGKDVSDLLDAGYTLDDVDPLSDVEEVAAYVAANVRMRRVEWAWGSYVPLGKLSLIEGDPGDGKSVLTVDLAARWSSGAPMPDGTLHDGPWPVFMVSAEDDLEDTIVPRLVAAGARLDYVTLFPHGATPERPFSFADDLPSLERRAVEVGARVIFFDPLAAFLSSTLDSHNDMQVRQALYPLAALASRLRAAVIGVRHLTKGGQGVKAVHRGNGSIGFSGAARAGFLVAPDPDDPGTRVLARVKGNLSEPPPSLRYGIVAGAEGLPVLDWRGASTEDAQGLLDGPRRGRGDDEAGAADRRAREYESAFLVDLLRSGPMSWVEIVSAGKVEGFSEHSLRRARADVGLVKVFGEEGNRTARWMLRPSAMLEETGQEAPSHLPEERPLARQVGGSLRGVQTPGASGQVDKRCDVCGSSKDVVEFTSHGVTRCLTHDPNYYGRAAS